MTTSSEDANSGPVLEPDTQHFVDSTSSNIPAPVPPTEVRVALERRQSQPVGKPDAQSDDVILPLGPTGRLPVRIIRPREVQTALPGLLYCHGGGWIAGDADTHDRLVRELATDAGAAVVVVNHDRAPEAQYPVAIEQAYAALQYLATNGGTLNIDPLRLAIAGDDTGATIAAAVTMLARERRGPEIILQVLICPVLDADFDTGSYRRFADGPWLTRAAMRQAWDAYLPNTARRAEPHAAPLRATAAELANLPEALVIVAEYDVTRDEGECYARKLSAAGVRVTSARFNGTIHDFLVLNALADTPAARGAIALIVSSLTAAFG